MNTKLKLLPIAAISLQLRDRDAFQFIDARNLHNNLSIQTSHLCFALELLKLERESDKEKVLTSNTSHNI